MVIGSMFVYHFVNSEVRVETIFRKERTAENGGIDFEIENIDISAHSLAEIPTRFIKKLGQKFESECLLRSPTMIGRRKKIKYTMCSDGLKQRFPKLFIFKESCIFFVYFS